MSKEQGRAAAGLPDVVVLNPRWSGTVPPGTEAALDGALAALSLSALRAMAGARGLAGRGAAREALVAAIQAHLLDPEAQAAVIAGLAPAERAALAAARVLDWTRQPVLPGAMQRLLTHLGVPGRQAAGVAATLRERGLLLPQVIAGTRARPDGPLHLPAGPAAALLPLVPVPPPVTLPAIPPAPAGTPALHKLDALLDALGGEPLPVQPPSETYRGQSLWDWAPWIALEMPPARRGGWNWQEQQRGIRVMPPTIPVFAPDQAARWQQAAGLADAAEAGYWFFLLSRLGLIGLNGAVVVALPGPVQAFRALAPAVRLARVIETGLALREWNELDQLLEADPQVALLRTASGRQPTPDEVQRQVLSVRQAVVALLAWLPIGPWYDRAGLIELVRRFFPDLPGALEVSFYDPGESDYTTWWLAEAGADGGWQRLRWRTAVGWSQTVGRLVEQALAGPLHWLGLVAHAGDALRLTAEAGPGLSRRPAPLGAVQPVAGPAPADAAPALTFPAPPPGDGLPRLALDPRRAGLDDQATLAALATPLRYAPDRYLYRLEPAGLRRLAAQGRDPQEAPATLVGLGGGPLPAGVAGPLADWLARYGRVRLTRGLALIRFDESTTLAALRAATPLAGYILHQFSPQLIAVAAEAVPAVTALCERAGYTPRLLRPGVEAPE